MPSRRYYIAIAPVEHMNGKLSQASEIVKNNPTSDSGQGVSFYYGYRLGNRPLSRFALREKARNLSVNPYTADETANKQYFKSCTQVVDAALQDPVKRASAEESFKRQSHYVYLRNYCIAMTQKNGGVFPF